MSNNDGLVSRFDPRHESPLVGMRNLLSAHGEPNGEFFVNEKPHVSLCVFRATPDDEELLAAAAAVLGVALPIHSNRFTECVDVRASWLGPDEWMLASQSWSARDIESRLRGALAGRSYSVVDVTSGYTMVQLSGRKVPLVLARGCPLDFSPGAFDKGDCAQSVYFKSPLMISSDGEGVYDLIIRRSFAEYFILMMLDAYKPIQQANLRY